MVNITNEQDSSDKFKKKIEKKLEEQKEEKPRFQQIVELSTPTMRMQMMQMIQLGLNPFSPEDIKHFQTIQKNGAELTLWERLCAACSLVFRNVVNEDLELLALKRINSKLPDEDHAIGLPPKAFSPLSEFVMPMPDDKEGKERAAFTERIIKGDPILPKSPSKEYKEDITNILKVREEAEKKAKEEIPVPEGAFIPGEVPVVFETQKKESKRVKIKQDLSKATKVEHLRGTGSISKVKDAPVVKRKAKPVKGKPAPVMLTKGKPKKRK